jgi:hypothetical protein
MINKRIDPALDRRRLVLFFAGLIVFYVGVVVITQPALNGGEAELSKITYGVCWHQRPVPSWRASSVPV